MSSAHLCILTHGYLSGTLSVHKITISILQRRKQALREQGCPRSQSWWMLGLGANPGTLASKFHLLTLHSHEAQSRVPRFSHSDFGPGWDLLSSLGPVQPQHLCSGLSLCRGRSLPLPAPLPKLPFGSQFQYHCSWEPPSLLRFTEASLRR